MKFSWKSALSPMAVVGSFLLVLFDQASKFAVIHYIEMGEQIAVTPFLNFVHTKNKGAAFGMFRDASPMMRLVIFGLVSIVCLTTLIYWLGTTPKVEKLQRASLVFIFGGALGNLVDRIAYGEVTDFIDVYYSGWHFWIFNIADSAITVGVILMGIVMLQRKARSTI